MSRSQLVFSIMGKRYGFNIRQMIKFVEENQYWSNDQIYDYQFTELKKIVKHAYDNVSFYRKTMQAMGMEPEDIRSLNDVQHFPVIGKKEIMADYNSFLAEDYRRYHSMERSTGGTTGVPFKYYIDTKSWGLNWATKIRSFNWGGYRFGADKIAVLKGGSMLRKGDFSLKTHFWKYLHNYYTIPIINMTSESTEYYFKQIAKRKIRFIRGFPSALFIFAKHLNSKGIRYDMKGIFTSAEMLYDHQRELIERVFGRGIIDVYGCGDGMAGAHQCELHQGYHINVETSYMEILGPSAEEIKPGEEGEIVVTSLHDYAMPMIRYSPGDRAIKGMAMCECGRTLPVLDKIIGRTADLFELPNGRVLNGLSIPIEDWIEKIEKFQLIHEMPDLIRLKIIPKSSYSKKDEKAILDLLKYNAGEGIRIFIDIVDEIEQTSAGKFRYVISKVRN